MLSVVVWKWQPCQGYRSLFGAAQVNTLFRMVDRHYRAPYRPICVTDDPTGIDPRVDIVPLWQDFAEIPNPRGKRHPSCYRRLRAFAADAATFFGPRFVSIDLDSVIVGDLTPLWERPEDFVIYGEVQPQSWYNGSMWLLTAGARRQVYEQFSPETSPAVAHAAGRFGSDQGWISYLLGPGEAVWTKADGVYSYRTHLKASVTDSRVRGSGPAPLPTNARIVFFNGHVDPWSTEAQALPWVREHYC